MALLSGTRWPKLGALSVLLLGAAVFLAHQTLGSGAALALLVAASIVLLGAMALVTRRRVRRANERSILVEHALETVSQAIFVVDPRKARNRYVNAAYSALTGYAAREALDGDFDALSIFADRTKIPAFDALAAPAAASVRVRRRDGSTLSANLELRTVRLGDGGYVVGRLEHGEGDGERASHRPPGAGPDAQSSRPETGARPKDAFLSWLNHELRSPLNACVMWLDVLALAPQPDKLAKAVDAIQRNLARQTRLVNDLNDAAKVSAGGIEMSTEPVDLVALLERNLEAWQVLAMGRRLAFRHAIEIDEARVLGDPERLAQALNHLLESSILSTPPAGHVELRAHGGDGSWIVEIEDTGAALSADDAANLGAPLWRAPGGAKARAGLGLGLAVAHHIAVRHGGSLTATGGASGARFALTLPMAGGTKLDARAAGPPADR